MIIDAVAYLGHWPFRKLPCETAAAMTARMDRAGIDVACVSALSSVFYLDVMDGNRELMEDIAADSDRFIPFAIINPAYPGWEHDFYECFDVLGMKGLEIFPSYHGYAPDLPALKRLMELAAERRIPVRLPGRLIDPRGRHRLDTAPNLTPEQMEAIVSLCPATDFLLCACLTVPLAQRLSAPRPGRIYYDFLRLEQSYISYGVSDLLNAAGTDRVVLGTGAPFFYPEVQLLKLDLLEPDAAAFEKIVAGNLLSLLP